LNDTLLVNYQLFNFFLTSTHLVITCENHPKRDHAEIDVF
jgi:hypothetical protein